MRLVTLTCEYILYDLFAIIHHDFSRGTGAIVWVHADSEIVPKDIDKWTAARAKSKHSTVLGIHCYPNWCEWWHSVSMGPHALQMKLNKINKVFSMPSHSHKLIYLSKINEIFRYICSLAIRGPFYLHQLTLIPTQISNYIHYKVWDEIIYSFPNVNIGTTEVWEWIPNFISSPTWLSV